MFNIICFIEALRNPNPQIRHVMNLETCISVVAGYFYGVFVDKLNKVEKEAKEAKETGNKTITSNFLVICNIMGAIWSILSNTTTYKNIWL